VARPHDPRGLRKSKDLQKLVKTKHVELHPIVVSLVKGLNALNKHRFPRTRALEDATTVSRALNSQEQSRPQARIGRMLSPKAFLLNLAQRW
jgi:hypothetical protein